MVVFENVFKNINTFRMKDISFTIPKGYIMGLIGVNGSGKSTLLNILMGLYKTDTGKVIRFNSKGEEISLKEFRDKCGYVLQGDWFEEILSFKDNADLFGKYYTNYNEVVFDEYMKRFNLDVKKKYKASSRGERLKFQFAFALSHAPEILVLDEPTASFDPEFKQDFIQIITEFVEDGERSVIMATHITEELDRIADYITFIDDGKLIFSVDKERLYDSYRLVKGEDYQINLIAKERIVYKESGSCYSTAIIRNNGYYKLDSRLSVEIPTIEDIMYYGIKGGVNNVKIVN